MNGFIMPVRKLRSTAAGTATADCHHQPELQAFASCSIRVQRFQRWRHLFAPLNMGPSEITCRWCKCTRPTNTSLLKSLTEATLNVLVRPQQRTICKRSSLFSHSTQLIQHHSMPRNAPATARLKPKKVAGSSVRHSHMHLAEHPL